LNLQNGTTIRIPIKSLIPNLKTLVFAISLVFGFSGFCETLRLPERTTNAVSGSEFVKRITGLDFAQRERELFTQIASGNVPAFLRRLCPVEVTNVFDGHTNRATFYVTPDYLAVGSDDDYFLTPMSPNTGQRIADQTGCILPTRKMVNEIYCAAEVKLAPTPIPPSPAMTTVPVFSNHNALVWTQRLAQVAAHPLGALTAGHQKDVVLAGALPTAPGKVAIYGWHQTNRAPIQPLYLGHAAAWVDYSQCIRLVHQSVSVNGEPRNIAEVLADPELSGLFSDEGTFSEPRYPTNALAPLSATGPAPKSAPAVPVGVAGSTAFQETNAFHERIASFRFEPEVKVLVNAPPAESFNPGQKVLLVFYALPNGNTIEQTIGKPAKPGDDWHYNIQHIGAQTRFLRQMLPERPIVVAYLESDLKSWPAWRKKHGDKPLPEIVAAVRKMFATNDLEVALNGHSGGGSFIFGYLNEMETIPDDIVRIAFLDSDYAYDNALGHKEKLTAWLKKPEHFLCVLAYNDAIARLDGKPFVSAAGGTWGRSHLMQADLAQSFSFTGQTNGDFQRFNALAGRVQFIMHENPERKILHTVQVERNGFIHSMVSATKYESKGYEYFGERAYEKWIAE
jgi:hypothetical protein